jgi:hypothetical protein
MKPLAVVKIWGGVGNQLFCYAFAKYLSVLHPDIDVKIETFSGFHKDGYKRKYRLNFFNLSIKKAPLYMSLFFLIRKKFLFVRMFLFKNAILCEEKDNCEFIVPDNKNRLVFYEGYWQKIDYSNIRWLLLEDFKINLPHNDRFDEWSKLIRTTNSVAIHVRKIDYAEILPNDYYKKATDFINNVIDNPAFYVFSDDITYCKSIFSDFSTVCFINNFKNELYELRLMSLCNHFIIANSTFSWWGAWLSTNENKTVIMPKEYLISCMHGNCLKI